MCNVDSHRYKDVYSELFISCEKSIYLCLKRKFTAFVIFKNTVYYRDIKFESLISDYEYNKNSTLYVLVPDKYESSIITIGERVEFYSKGIYNNISTFTDNSDVMTIETLNDKINSLEDTEWIKQHHKNLYKYLINANVKNNFKFKINPWDLSWGLNEPTFVKSRLRADIKKSVLIPLEDLYMPIHILSSIEPDIPFVKKKNLIVWRGANSGPKYNCDKRPSRLNLVKLYHDHHLCDIGFCDMRYKNNIYDFDINKATYIKGRMKISKQLEFKFIVSVEGNDFATNFFWILLSNSIPICPVHLIDTWNYEPKLIPWKHYIPVKNDFSDLIINYNKIKDDEERCLTMLFEKKLFASQFLNQENEYYIINKTIEVYIKNIE